MKNKIINYFKSSKQTFAAWIDSRVESVYIKISWLIPRKLAYWSTIRVMANASTGEHSNQNVTSLLAIDTLKRWKN
jgi:hypothetical protein